MSNEVQETHEEIHEEEYIELTEAQLESIIAQVVADSELTNEERIENKLFNNRVIYLSGVVEEGMAYGLISLIHYYNSVDDENEIEPEDREPIKLYVDSEGGELYRGMAMISAIKNSKTPVWTYLDGGIGMSAGMLLFLAGHVKHMSSFAHILYHELRYATDVMTLAEAQNLVKHYARLQDKVDRFIVENSNIPMERLHEQRAKNMDWYIDFDIAKEYNLFDIEI